MSPRRPSRSRNAFVVGVMALVVGGISTIAAANTLPATTDVGDLPAILLGMAWYPEQWPEEAWERDLTLMEEAGVRMESYRLVAAPWLNVLPGPEHDVFVLLNHGRAPASVELPRPMRDLLGEGAFIRQVRLPVEGIGVLADAGGAKSRSEP